MTFRSDALAAALEAQDAVAVAFALRNDRVAVPLLGGDEPQVRVFTPEKALAWTTFPTDATRFRF